MINYLKIANFKSIKKLDLTCRKINIFIGEPNTGKSNLLEALGLLSYTAYGENYHLKDFIRFETMNNLFFDDDIENDIEIEIPKTIFNVKSKDLSFNGQLKIFLDSKRQRIYNVFNYNYRGSGSNTYYRSLNLIKFYRFKKQNAFKIKHSGFLLPPYGDNLLAVLIANKELKNIISQLLSRFGYRLMFKPQEDKIEIVKQYDDVLISIPYALISDTFQRLIFYLTAILSNKDSVLIFEEPESHTFPYYTKFLAETIALDNKNNQFFISTHNPYFLFSVLEKSKKDNIAVFVVYMENFETKARKLTQQEIEEAMNIGLDFFFNLDRFRNEEQG